MQEPIKIVLIDDEISPRIICRNYLSQLEQVTIVGEASTVAEAQAVIDATNPDIILLDIQLGNQTGFELLQLYSKPSFKVLFVTAFEQYALAAIKAGALDYLLKPIDEEELKNAVLKAIASAQQSYDVIQVAQDSFQHKKVERITLSANDGFHIIWVKDIVYCSASGNYTTFHLENGKTIVISKILKEYENLLPDALFLRVHQSYLVNMNYVEKFSKDQFLILKSGAEIAVATRKKEEVIHWIKKLS